MPEAPDIIRAAYAELHVSSLPDARRFWVDLLGFAVTEEASNALYLRGYDELTHHNLVLRTGYTAGVGETVRVEDPLGFTVEFFAAASHPARLQQRYDLRRGAEIARLDHFNISVPDVPRAYSYYSSLGFGLSETIEDSSTLYAAWMYRKQTVHDVAFTGGAGPRLHHLGFFAHEAHSVLRMCDILGSLSLESCIERGPGRHGVSNAFYVYLRDPDGHRLEIYTSDYYTGDPDHPVLRWSVRDPRRRDFWGNPVVPSWYSEASLVLDLDGKPQPVTEIAQAEEASVRVGADGFTAPAE
jgi:catechol 2,3-dioxygenase-like lactoylglutathione lyase family enzyme